MPAHGLAIQERLKLKPQPWSKNTKSRILHSASCDMKEYQIIGSLCVHMFVVAVTALLLCHDVCPQRAQKTELLYNMRS